MKFSAREDIEAPIDHVFERASDFAGFERSAMRRGADVQRLDAGTTAGVGSTWKVAFDFRGRRRDVTAKIVSFDPPNGFTAEATSGGLDSITTLELLPLSPRRTRMSFAIELKPTSLSARLMLQSLKLAKQSLSKRFKKRVAEFAQDIEDRHRKAG